MTTGEVSCTPRAARFMNGFGKQGAPRSQVPARVAVGQETRSSRDEVAMQLLEQQAQAIQAAMPDMALLRADHKQWFERYEDTSLYAASAADFLELMQSAPTGFAKGMVYGAFMARMDVVGATGGEF